ncbi:hypothetical protein V8F20_011303 [Naviculisporaceae sp. PSN 640]
MDSLQILMVDSPFANMTSLYQVDPEADVLLIVPPFNPSSFAPSPGTSSAATVPGLRLKVSSKHLTLSSKPFKNKLHSTKSSQVQSDGRIHISLSPTGNFDPKAVTISLNAVHGRGSKVPKVVDLETLARITYFVDKFQLHDTVDIYADRWISNLWKDFQINEETSQRDLVLWIYIAHAFKQAEIFRVVTRQAALGASGPIDTLGLPIREKIIKHIDALRQDIVGASLRIIHSAVQSLVTGSAKCDKNLCDNFLLGDLIKTLHRSGHTAIWSEPVKPFPGASFTGIVKAIGGTSTQLDRFSLGGSLWTANGGKAITNGNKKRKSPNAGPITPDSSPEPVSRTNGINGGGLARIDNVHECEARKVFARLDDIEDLEDSVKGLELESSLGYQLY